MSIEAAESVMGNHFMPVDVFSLGDQAGIVYPISLQAVRVILVSKKTRFNHYPFFTGNAVVKGTIRKTNK